MEVHLEQSERWLPLKCLEKECNKYRRYEARDKDNDAAIRGKCCTENVIVKKKRVKRGAQNVNRH